MKNLFEIERIFELKDIVWFMIGWIVPIAFSKLHKKFVIKKMNHKIIKTNNDYIEVGKDVLPLSHGVPVYSKNNLLLGSPVETFHFKMPEHIHERLCIENPYFDHTSWNEEASYWGSSDEQVLLNAISDLSENINENELKDLLEEKKNEIAEMFLNRRNEAFFNGEMYGIKEVKDHREGKEEIAIFKAKSIRTDYYTHRVMSAIYQALIKEGNLRSPEGVHDINQYYPFLTSLGMNVIMVIENKKKIVLTKRSKKLINMTDDLWHLSMNEAISITDIRYGQIDLDDCVRRGLVEELGIKLEEIGYSTIHYCDVFMLTNPLEVGIFAVLVCDNLTEVDIKNCYNTAQDAPLESTGNDRTGLKFLSFNSRNISKFLETEETTSAVKYALKMLLIRKDYIDNT